MDAPGQRNMRVERQPANAGLFEYGRGWSKTATDTGSADKASGTTLQFELRPDGHGVLRAVESNGPIADDPPARPTWLRRVGN